MHKETTVGTLFGSSIGAAGGVTALVGLGLSFFTFGASLAVSAVGVAVGIAGGVTGATFNIINMILQDNLRGNIENIIKDFQRTINPMIEHLNEISKTIGKLQQEEQTYSVLNKAIMTGVFGRHFTLRTVSETEGDSVTLNSELTGMKDVDVIQWRFGYEKTLIAEINKWANSFTVYDDVLDGRFRDRLKLDNQTGSLTITNITTEHAGQYHLTIKSKKIT
ncbi:Apolipoprotein L3 [Anabarilius grahami]|uniref:Apolipoprotein L3 n=1 Tax=Anabarilius grahami TaxID=495550 RepID=A0A3N0Z945_ANAGA|nr:Apolipoprotein L3 [Anabarilius grahami]